ncbi:MULTISPECIES: class A beta-lactamase [Legionella]|uniref:class A beta-lactamase n=2 Tax=Legionellaceae TaxID=444 RepID=UPI001E36263B|nr:class A beta-lactamase [Legionella sp. 31fI33]MCC5013818.1 class A beta-lactamase [Legionella sp. 31fI33]
MKHFMKGKLFLKYINRLLNLFLCLVLSMNCFAANSEAQLVKKIYDIEKRSNAVIGITAIHIEKNKVIGHNGNKRFFMASTIKLPIAIAFLHLVDQKKDSLNRVVNLGLNNVVPGSGTLHYLCERKKIRMSLQQILKYMMANSDNSASDTLLQTVNGPAYVTKRMHALGFKNIVINRSIIEMMMDTNHVHPSLKQPRSVYSWKKIFNRTPLKEKMLAWQRFEKDPRDTTTPAEMAKLLVKIYKNEALSESSTKVLMDIMEKCRTGRSRIRGLLPPYVKVAHKTGTWAIDEPQYIRYPGSNKLFRFVSDVGIITLPNNKGHIAIAVYVKSRAVSNYTRSRAIALASRAIYDHFMAQK